MSQQQQQAAAAQRAQQQMQQTQMMGTRTMGPQGAPQRMMPAAGGQRNGLPPAQYKGYNQQARGAQGTNQSYVGAAPAVEPLATQSLAQASAQDQKQMLGERIFPIVQQTFPEEAGKITGMLLEMDNAELLIMLDDVSIMKSKINEAMIVLRQNKPIEG
jgi:polyadenylate-binding protein